MIIRREKQLSPVTDEVTSIIAVIRPILQGLLYSLKEEVVMQSGGYENIPLFIRNYHQLDFVVNQALFKFVQKARFGKFSD